MADPAPLPGSPRAARRPAVSVDLALQGGGAHDTSLVQINPIVVVAIVGAIIALAAVIVLGTLFGSF